MKSHRYLWLGAAVLGFAAGMLARKSGSPGPAGSEASAASGAEKSCTVSGAGPVSQAAVAVPVSGDRLEDLLGLTEVHELYLRLALWLPEASEADCMALLQTECERRPPDDRLAILILSRWTRLNPMAALAATKGSRFQFQCLLAWTGNDPRAAFAHVLKEEPGMASNVLSLIGRSDPHLAESLLAANPDLDPRPVMTSIVEALAPEDPERALELGQKYDIEESTALVHLTRRDPHAALAWLLENSGMADERSCKEFITTLVASGPEALDSIIAATPSGSLKRSLEDEKFRLLADGSPEEALQMARATGAPLIATERLTEVGKRLAKTDPAAALGILGEIFTRYPGQLVHSTALVKQMVATDPEATMTAALEGEQAKQKGSNGMRPFSLAANEWAQKDPDAFAIWLEGQEGGHALEEGAPILARKLDQLRRFPEAIGWAQASASKSSYRVTPENIFRNWVKRDPSSARRWIEEGNAPQELNERLSELLPAP